jgi:catechol 2,3-dioxygenase-like lactoylglutathione lyase family enzyme
MAVQLNHTIVWCKDKQKAASFLSEVLGLGAPVPFGPFLIVELSNGVSLDYYSIEGDIARQHYAFLVSEEEFDTIFARIQARSLEYWADPARSQLGQINRHDGGRGTYFQDPDGHLLEIITRPYGSGA